MAQNPYKGGHRQKLRDLSRQVNEELRRIRESADSLKTSYFIYTFE